MTAFAFGGEFADLAFRVAAGIADRGVDLAKLVEVRQVCGGGDVDEQE